MEKLRPRKVTKRELQEAGAEGVQLAGLLTQADDLKIITGRCMVAGKAGDFDIFYARFEGANDVYLQRKEGEIAIYESGFSGFSTDSVTGALKKLFNRMGRPDVTVNIGPRGRKGPAIAFRHDETGFTPAAP